MWIRASDALSENVFQVVTAVSSHHLILGECSALIDAGISTTADSLIAEIEKVLGEEGTLEFVLLTHADFDHCGGLPTLRARWPELEVFASPSTAQKLSKKEVVEKIFEKNKTCAEATELGFDLALSDFVDALKVDRIMGDGDVLDIGADVEVKMIGAPGHAQDLVAYYTRPDCVLFGGEAVGQYNGRDQAYASFTDNYQSYLASLDKLSTLDIKILGFSHSGTLSGELVGRYFLQAREYAERFAATVQERVAQGELQEEVLAAMLSDWKTLGICPEGPFVEEQEASLRAMIKAAATVTEKSE